MVYVQYSLSLLLLSDIHFRFVHLLLVEVGVEEGGEEGRRERRRCAGVHFGRVDLNSKKRAMALRKWNK